MPTTEVQSHDTDAGLMAWIEVRRLALRACGHAMLGLSGRLRMRHRLRGMHAACSGGAAVLVFALVLILAACNRPPRESNGTPCRHHSIIAFGDSITFGAGLSPSLSYPARLSALLRKPVCNAGVNGNTTALGLARLDADVLRFEPVDVLILFGTNDCGLFGHSVPLAAFRSNLEEMVRHIRSAGGTPILMSLTPLNAPLLRQRGLNPSAWSSYDAAIRALATADSVPLIDLGRAFGGNAGLLADGIHPTAAGAALIARAAADFLASPAGR